MSLRCNKPSITHCPSPFPLLSHTCTNTQTPMLHTSRPFKFQLAQDSISASLSIKNSIPFISWISKSTRWESNIRWGEVRWGGLQAFHLVTEEHQKDGAEGWEEEGDPYPCFRSKCISHSASVRASGCGEFIMEWHWLRLICWDESDCKMRHMHFFPSSRFPFPGVRWNINSFCMAAT